MTVGKSSGIATILSPMHYMGIFPYMPFKPLQHPGRNAVRTGSHGLTLSTSPHKRGMEIMQLWPPGFHTWPSLSPRIWWTTEMDGHAHSIRRQKPASVPQDVSCPQNRRSATASAARSRTTAPLDSSRSNARGESGTQSVDVWPTRLAPVCPYASGDYRGSHEWS